MIGLALALIIIIIIYVLFVKGYLWKLIILIFSAFGMYWFVSSLENGSATLITILGYNISWAVAIPTIVIILAMATTRINKNEV